MRWLAIAIVLASCDRFYGLEHADCLATIGVDLDGDGIDDGCDPCIAPESDATADFDGDMIANGSDACPWDKPGDATDSDGDGIPDLCDPFPNAADHERCLMMFTSSALTAKLWAPAFASTGLSVLPGRLHADNDSARLASAVTESIEAPDASTTYKVRYATTPGVGTTGHFAVLPRVLDNHFLGCEVEIAPIGQVQLEYISDGTLSNAQSHLFSNPLAGTLTVVLTVQIVPGDTDTIVCNAFATNGAGSLDVVDLDTSGTSPDQPGTFGLFTQTWAVDVLGIEIFDER